MRTILIPEKGRAVFKDNDRPVCSDTGVIIQTLYSGLSNGTERNFLLGANYGAGFPRYPGYQILGRIVERGAAVTAWNLDDLVFCANVGPGHWEYVTAEADSLLVKLHEDDDLEAMALLAIATVAYRNTVRLNLKVGERALIIGGGVIGQIAAQTAKLSGVETTLVAGEPDKLDAARACGVDHVMNRHDADHLDQLEAAKPWDAILETSGADILDTLIGRTWDEGLFADEGRLALVAGRDTISYNSNAAQGSALAIYQSAHFNLAQLRKVTELVRTGVLHIRPLIKDVVPIEEALDIYTQLYEKPSSLFGTVFKW
jgi:2-desacetyl-2-hydroxyethyl bacteriochlorophyllide A dehydrogenase